MTIHTVSDIRKLKETGVAYMVIGASLTFFGVVILFGFTGLVLAGGLGLWISGLRKSKMADRLENGS